MWRSAPQRGAISPFRSMRVAVIEGLRQSRSGRYCTPLRLLLQVCHPAGVERILSRLLQLWVVRKADDGAWHPLVEIKDPKAEAVGIGAPLTHSEEICLND